MSSNTSRSQSVQWERPKAKIAPNHHKTLRITKSLGGLANGETGEHGFEPSKKRRRVTNETLIQGMDPTMLSNATDDHELPSPASVENHDLHNVINAHLNTTILLFASKNVELEALKALVSQKTQDAGTKDSILEELARAIEAATMRSSNLEETLKMAYASDVEQKNELQTVLERKGESQRENQHLRETATLAPTLQGHGEAAVGACLALHSNFGVTELEDYCIILETDDPELKGNGGLERQVHELQNKIRDLEAKDIGREMELAAGRHREEKLRRENASLLDERDLLHRTLEKYTPLLGTLDTDIDALREGRLLALEELKQQKAHNAKLKIARDVTRKKLVEISTERDGLVMSLEETKSTSMRLERTLEASQADFKGSQVALEKLQTALKISEGALEGSAEALGGSRAALSSSEKSLGLINAALSESTAALSETKRALAESNHELSQSKQHVQYATILTERWKETCLSERQANIHFLSRLATAGATVNDALAWAKKSVLEGANSVLERREGVEPAMYRMMALVNLEINRRVGQGQTSKDWVGLGDIYDTGLASSSQEYLTSSSETFSVFGGTAQSTSAIIPFSSDLSTR